MLKKLNKKNEGFTIVETLIVLAIAALILIIVLIAVPDLQRSSRNTNTTTDANNIATTIQSFEGNNDGQAPNAISLPAADGTITVCYLTAGAPAAGKASAAATECPAASITGAIATGHIQASEAVYIEPGGWATGAPTTAADGNIYVSFAAECPTGLPSSSAVTTGTSARGIAIMYLIETSSSTAAWNCTQE